MAKSNLYAMLGLLRSATQDEIRRAYLKYAKKLHPDTNVAPGETEIFLDVQQAYQVLSDPQRRSSYDATLSGEETDALPSPLDVDILVSRKHIPAGSETQLVYVLMTFTPAVSAQESGAPPLNLCLALDTSTSMKGGNLDMVKVTVSQMLRRMRPQDVFSVISFNDRAEVVVPASRQANLHRAENRVQMLQTSGGTEILRGLEAAAEEVRRFTSPGMVNHIILLTDGRTYGDEQACYNLASELARDGIGISGLGIGSGWNDVFLDQLATLTGGNSMYVSQPADIEKMLNEKFSHLSQAFAENILLHLEESPQAELRYAFRIQPEVSPLTLDKDIRLGPVLRDTALSVIFEINLTGPKTDGASMPLLTGRLETLAACLPTPAPELPLQISAQIKSAVHTETPPQILVQALSKLTLYRMQEKARLAVEQKDYPKATQHLQRLATHLLGQGEQALARTILLEVENLERNQAFSEAGEKRIKYGTRALFLPTGDTK